jgi:hypothetical protein
MPRHEIDVAMASRLTWTSALAGVREVTALSPIVPLAQYPQMHYDDDMIVAV